MKNITMVMEMSSILISPEGNLVEIYFLFDITSGYSDYMDYSELAQKLSAKTDNVDEIQVYIFRDKIGYFDLATLINGQANYNENGLVKVFAMQEFFDEFFADEYETFISYVNDFFEKINREISYKTVIVPSQNTLKAFREKKAEFLKCKDYKEIAELGMSGSLSEEEFQKVYRSFIENKMYLAMASTNDFAESFVSSEWSYDVYRNAMGELELTGIVAGYLKSIEQLLFTVARFHIDQGFKIKSKEGYIPFTKDNEAIIDSTL